MKREKRLTKREQKALKGGQPGAGAHAHQHDEEHIHCVACGRHIDLHELQGASPSALRLTCQHGGRFASCAACAVKSRGMLAMHDLTGQPVQQAPLWH